MQSFNVINFDFNRKKFLSYDIMPYLVNAYNERVKRYHEIELEASKCKTDTEFNEYKDALDYWKIPKSFDEFKKFVKKESAYQFWGRCEYEVILVDWPCQGTEEKIDVYWQILMNLNLITRILIENVCE